MRAVRLPFEVEVREHNAPPTLVGGVVIDGFPSIGFVSTISSTCIVTSQNLTLVGELWSDAFPSLATVFQGQLQAPARLYADATRNLAVFLGDFSPEPVVARAVARSILRATRAKEYSLVVTSLGLPLGEGEQTHEVSAVANLPSAVARVRETGIGLARLAAVSGVAGSLLEGRDAGVPVIALLIKTHEESPDFEAAIRLTEALGRLVPAAQCEVEPLRAEAERTEQALRRLRSQAAPAGMYR